MINFSKLSLVKDLYYSLDKDIVKVVDSYHDPIITKKILSNVYAWNEEDNIHLNTLLKGTDHHRDFRDNRGYAFNIILNWLVEDLIYEVLFLVLLLSTRLVYSSRLVLFQDSLFYP